MTDKQLRRVFCPPMAAIFMLVAMLFCQAAASFAEGIHRFKTDKPAALATLEKYTKQKTTPGSEKIYEIYATKYFKRLPEATAPGIQTILEEISATRPLPAGVTPQRFADSRFVRELVSTGFVDTLYKSR
jgi:hypothetical protein